MQPVGPTDTTNLSGQSNWTLGGPLQNIHDLEVQSSTNLHWILLENLHHIQTKKKSYQIMSRYKIYSPHKFVCLHYVRVKQPIKTNNL
jgi:hypothetical protein